MLFVLSGRLLRLAARWHRRTPAASVGQQLPYPVVVHDSLPPALPIPILLQVLLNHSDEVWHLQFSHDGGMLASCGKDQTAIIWDVQRSSSRSSAGGGGGSGGSSGDGSNSSSGTAPGGSTLVRRHVLRGHTGPVAFLCWSPDDSQLATCGAWSEAGPCQATLSMAGWQRSVAVMLQVRQAERQAGVCTVDH
jgi:WD40 repeat protein